MHEDTTAFLQAMKDRTAINTEAARNGLRFATELVMDAVAEALALQSMFRRVEHRETDAEILSVMGEYGQKLGALRKTGEELEANALRFERILDEIEELDARVGDPLREPPDA